MNEKKSKGNAIADFLASRSFAVVGVSADRRKFGNGLFREMRGRGFSVLPVHRSLNRVEGDECYHSVTDLRGKVEAVVTAVPPGETERVLRECAGAGIRRIWMMKGSSSERTISLAQELGLDIVTGECPLMYLEPVRSIHKVHRWTKRLFGGYTPPVRA